MKLELIEVNGYPNSAKPTLVLDSTFGTNLLIDKDSIVLFIETLELRIMIPFQVKEEFLQEAHRQFRNTLDFLYDSREDEE